MTSHPVLRSLLLAILLLALAPAAPAAAPAPAKAAAAAGADAKVVPWVLHLNGIGGERSIDHSLVRGLKAGGVEADFQIYDWTGGEVGIPALVNVDAHRREARRIADLIVARRKDHPGQPIILTGHSAGAGLVVWALELLPDDLKVEQVFLLAPALSPTYDLSKALSHVRGSAHVFTSPYDVFILSTGTKMFGTVDGLKVEAAGVKGFVKPDAPADAAQYEKLVHHAYDKSWALLYGNLGSHICCMRFKFARDYVATVLRTGKPPEAQAQAAARAPAATRPAQALR